MKRLLLLPLRVLLPVLLLSCAVAAGLISWKLSARVLEDEIEEYLDDARLRITALQADLEYHFRKRDAGGVDLAVSGMAMRNDVIATFVLDRQDRIVAATRRAMIGNAAEAIGASLPKDLKGRHAVNLAQVRASEKGSMVISEDRRVAIACYPLTVDADDHALRPTRNGLVVLVLDTQMARARALRAIERQALENVLVFGGLAACAWVFIHFSLTRRVAGLVATTRRLASGDLSARSGIEGNDELAQVARAFDLMATRIAEDILRREQVEAELRESQRFAESIAENSPSVIYLFDLETRRSAYSNRSVAEFLGYSQAQIVEIGDNLLPTIIHPEDLPEMAHRLAHFSEVPDNRVTDIEYRVKHASGDWRWMWARETVFKRRPDGAAWQIMGTAQDITERKQAEEELSQSREALRELNTELERRVVQRTEEFLAATQEAERANCAKSEFLSRMSHELRTPMNAILGFAQVLETEEGLTTDQRDSVDQILHGGSHLLSLINEVLDITSIDAGRMMISAEPVALLDLVEESVGFLRPLAAELKVQLAVAPEEAVGQHVLADRQRLKQVLLNLLGNAIKYNRPGKSVTVRWAPLEVPARSGAEPVIRLSVTDTGMGLSAEKLARLFNPFERLGAEQTRIEGTGLGLVLARRMVEQMGGTLGVESVAGEGSTFWVELRRTEPSAQPEEHFRDDSVLPAAAMPTQKRILLYVEDNPANIRLVTRILARRPGIDLLSAETGALGLSMAREHRPDLILLDLHLPDSHGTDVLARLAADPRTGAIPVVMLSADAVPGKRAEMLAAGARAFMTKPLDVRNFLSMVDQFLAREPAEAA